MRHWNLDSVTEIGQRVDPIIFRALSKGSHSNFLAPLNYQVQVGGKRMRAALTLSSCVAAGGSVADALNPAAAVELIHNYSLVMDDLIDRGKVRRGKPTIRVLGGDSVSLLIAMHYREVIDEILDTCPRSPKIRHIAVRTMKEIIDGERLDLLYEQAGRDDPYLVSNRITVPSFDSYVTMIGKKTASLFMAAAEAGGHAAGANGRTVTALGEFGWKAGLAFQVMDDVLDICGDATGKEAAKDVIEHKLGNAAILVALRYLKKSSKNELLGILRTEKVSRKMAQRARLLVLQTPAETECKEIARAFLNEAKSHLRMFAPSRGVDLIVKLSDLMISRKF